MATPPLRQPLAIVFCDISGTGALNTEFGDFAISTVLRDFYEQTGRLCSGLRCASLKFIGDGFLGAFEDAAEVVPLAHALQDAFRSVPALNGRGLSFGFSVHFADVLCVETSYGKDVFGEEVNLAAHLVDRAKPDQIIVSEAAFDVLPAGQQALAGSVEVIHVKPRRSAPEPGDQVIIHRIPLSAL